eukprot:TRINITY_DN12626_c0_g1_i1.p1 TRINITY_DN12626_c0_g1~~TRINITY_DN12626_c0_g1_i1.p1  ORF type:complete len:662 (+),score=190.22 TRINITY_DN12626_c0_g1_i1:1794-3779(+)
MSSSQFSILMATDVHLGYCKGDPIRSQDSLDTFEEVLQIAKEHNVDFILLGGDLFHDNQPGRPVLYKTMELLRKYCLGSRPLSFRVLSPPEVCKSSFGYNFEDPNVNVAMPIFSIHGNHDDPAGDLDLCALDILSSAGLINHFGQVDDVSKVTVHPICLEKNGIKLALYGIGSVRDDRLHRTFLEKNVAFMKPEGDNWFQMLVLHQNRVKHGEKNYIPETFLPQNLNFVMWGHEHRCEIDPVKVGELFISQPGSTIATAFSDGESIDKHVGILRIKLNEADNAPVFKVQKLPLTTVRPFEFADLVLRDLAEVDPDSSSNEIERVLKKKVEAMIKTAFDRHKERYPDREAMRKPLIRLRVDYSGGFSTVSVQRFGQAFVSKVANPKDILRFHRRRTVTKPTPRANGAAEDVDVPVRPDPLNAVKIEDILEEERLDSRLLGQKDFMAAVHRFVDKEEKDAIQEFVSGALLRSFDSNRDAELEMIPETDELTAVHVVDDAEELELRPPEPKAKRAKPAAKTTPRATKTSAKSKSKKATATQSSAVSSKRPTRKQATLDFSQTRPKRSRGVKSYAEPSNGDDSDLDAMLEDPDDEYVPDSPAPSVSTRVSDMTHLTELSQVSRFPSQATIRPSQPRRGLQVDDDDDDDEEDFNPKKKNKRRSQRR